MSRERFEMLDGMRGIAAILVMDYHYHIQANPIPLPNAFIAVDFFFILSGFVVMHAYGDRLAAGMSPVRYLAQRVIRLYPLMAISLLIGVPAFLLSAKMGHADFSARQVLASVASNLCFLPYLNDRTIFGTAHNTVGLLFPVNGPLWSISFEMVASGAFIVLCRCSQAALLKACLAALVLIIAGGMLDGFSTYTNAVSAGSGWGTQNLLGGFARVFYGFTCGMLLYQAREGLGRQYFGSRLFSTDTGCLALYLALAGTLMFSGDFHGLYYLLAITVLAPVLVMWGGEAKPVNRALLKISHFLGWMSFPVYCLHTPVFNWAKVLNEKYAIQTQAGVSPQVLAMGATLLLAVCIGQFVDAPARRWLRSAVDRPRQAHSIVYSQTPRFGQAMGFGEEN